MGDIAIRIVGLGKQFRIGKQERYRAFRDTLTDAFTAPFKRAYGLLRGNAAAASNLNETIWALKEVSFEVKKGEVIGIIGRNGAGKSTLLKILSRITEPTEGRAEIYGRVGALLEVGTGFHPELTGRENIYLNGAILGMSRAEINRKFDEIVTFAEVEKFIDTPVKHYSSGMGLRLGFSVAAHLEPEILIVDEVLAVGDAQFQKKCLGKMSEVAGQGRTVLFVSHNMTAVQGLCTKAIWLDVGTVRQIGNVNTLVSQYIRAGAQAVTSRMWDVFETAPGSATCRVHQIQVFKDLENITSTIRVNDPCTIAIDFWNQSENAYLHLTLHVMTEDGAMAFETGSYESGWHRRPIGPGLYRTVCHIPANLLNDGVYSLDLMFIRNETEVIAYCRSIFQFEIQDDLETRNIAYHGKWQGAVRPRFEWEQEAI